jgi:DNA replication and repair protein RecF
MDYEVIRSQVNRLLYTGNRAHRNAWYPQLAKVSEEVSAHYGNFFSRFRNAFFELCVGVDFLKGVEMRLESGWKNEVSGMPGLIASDAESEQRGFLVSGPHRADMKFKIRGRDAKYELSRGQKKVFAYLCEIAAEQVSHKITGKRSVLLLDDFLSDLDVESSAMLLEIIADEGNQSMVTVIDKGGRFDSWRGNRKMFHVEQGRIRDDNPTA